MAVIGTAEAILLFRDQFSSGLQRAVGQIKQAGATMQRTGRQFASAGVSMTVALTAPIALLGVGAVKAFSSFDDAITQSVAIMDDSSRELRADMEATAREVAKTLVPSAKEAAESFFFLASAGLNAEQSIAALPRVAEFAQAGMFDMATATDLLTDAQSALGLTVDDTVQNMENMTRISDVLVKANTLANASVEQFSTALTREAGAALKSFNIDVEEGVAVLAAFADQGVKGEIAGTGLSRILRLMTTAAVKNADAYKELNVEVFDSQGNINNLADIIGDLENALGDMSDQQRTVALDMLGFKARVQGVILPLLGTSDAIREYEGELRNAAGTTADVADRQMASFANQMKLLKDTFIDAGIELGQNLAPIMLTFTQSVILPLVDKLAALAEWFGNLPPPIQNIIVAVTTLVAAAGPLLFIVGQLLIAFGALAPLLPVIAGGFTFMLGPIGLVTVAMTALVAVGNSWIEQQNMLHAATLSNVESTQGMGMAINALRIELNAATEEQRTLNGELVRTVGEGLAPLGESLKTAKDKLAKLKEEAAAAAVEMGSTKFGASVKEANEKVEEQAGLVATLEGQWSAAQKLLAKAADQGFDPVTEAAGKFNTVVTEVGDSAVEAAAEIEETAQAADEVDTNFSAAIQPLEEAALAFDEVGEAASDTAGEVVDASDEIQASAVDLSRGFSSALGGFADNFGSSMSAAAEAGKISFGSIKEAGKGAFDGIAGGTDAVSVAFGAATGEWEGLAVGAMTAISKFASGDWVGAMIAAIGVVIGAFKKLFGGGSSVLEDAAKAFKKLGTGAATLGKLETAADVLTKAMKEMTSGALKAWEANNLLADNFDALFDAAVKQGEAGVAAIKKVVDAARAAGADMTVIQEKLDETLEKAEQAAADRTKFIEEQSRTILSSIEALFSGVGRVTRREVRFAATSVLQAFESMRIAGLPLTQIMAEIGEAVGLIGGRADELGLKLPKAFERFGEVLEILATTKITKVIGKLEVMGATVEAVGNLGLLTAEQFDTFGDRVDKTFSKLVNQGLTSEEALAALAPQLQQLNDLQEQYGFEVDKATQKLLDQAIAQGVVTEKGLTTEDILIKGFDRTIETLNRLIEALGGVPVAFEEWSDSAKDTTQTIEESATQAAVATTQAMDDIVNASVTAAAQNQQAWTGSFQALPGVASGVANQIASNLSGIPISFNASVSGPSGEVLQAQSGTGGFMNFGAGTPAVLHGNEAVVTAAEGVSLAEMVGSAIQSAMRGGGGGEGGAGGALANVEATKEVSEGVSALIRVVREWQADTIARSGAGTDRRWRQSGGKTS